MPNGTLFARGSTRRLQSLRKHRTDLRRDVERARYRIREFRRAGVRNQPLGWLSLAMEYAELAILILGDVADTLVITFGVYVAIAFPICFAVDGIFKAAGVAGGIGTAVFLVKFKRRY